MTINNPQWFIRHFLAKAEIQHTRHPILYHIGLTRATPPFQIGYKLAHLEAGDTKHESFVAKPNFFICVIQRIWTLIRDKSFSQGYNLISTDAVLYHVSFLLCNIRFIHVESVYVILEKIIRA